MGEPQWMPETTQIRGPSGARTAKGRAMQARYLSPEPAVVQLHQRCRKEALGLANAGTAHGVVRLPIATQHLGPLRLVPTSALDLLGVY